MDGTRLKSATFSVTTAARYDGSEAFRSARRVNRGSAASSFMADARNLTWPKKAERLPTNRPSRRSFAVGRRFTVNRARAATEVALDEALLSLSANPAAKAAFLQSHESRTVLHYVKAFSSLYGGTIFWIGLWELLWTWGATSLWRECVFFAVGMALVVVTDTLYFQGGLGGSFCPRCVRSHWAPNIARLALAPLGMVILWVGAFDLLASFVWFDSYVDTPSAGEYDFSAWAVQKCLIKDAAVFIGGLLALLVLGVSFSIANVEPPTTWTCLTRCNAPIALGEDALWRHALRCARSVVSVFAQVSVLVCTVTLHANLAHSLTRSP